MKAKAGLIPVAAALFVALAGVIGDADSARAEDDCLTAPNAPAPQGSHWYYHEDRATQRKCWYVRPQSQAAGEVAPQDKATAERPETGTAVPPTSGTARQRESPRNSAPETAATAPAPSG